MRTRRVTGDGLEREGTGDILEEVIQAVVREGGRAGMKQRGFEGEAGTDEHSMKCQDWSYNSVTTTLVP